MRNAASRLAIVHQVDATGTPPSSIANIFTHFLDISPEIAI
jgi:hypothetical protein